MEQEYITQILHTGLQFTFVILCLTKIKKNGSSVLLYLLIPSLLSFIQTFINLKYYNSKNVVGFNIALYLLIETYFHKSIIESFLNEKKKIILKAIKYFYSIVLLLFFISTPYSITEKTWISYLPIPIILVFGIYALKNLLKHNSSALIYNYNFWIVYSIIFIQLSSLPIEMIFYLFVDTVSYETRIIKLKAHQISYILYHVMLIYSLKWTSRK